MLQVAPGVFDTAPCHFPTEDLQQDSQGFKSVPVTWDSPDDNVAGPNPITSDAFLAAWSVVLRYYVGSDVISFGQIDDAADATCRFAVCHGEIPAETQLKSLCQFELQSSNDATVGQSPSDWIANCPSLNTVVWKKDHSPSILEHQDLENTQVYHWKKSLGSRADHCSALSSF